ncbi:XPG I-region, partial [Teladorsagia circumcincta]
VIEKQEAASSTSSEIAEAWDPAGDSDTRDSQWDDKDGLRNNVPSSRDSECYKDLQDFLTACGFPWIEAPGEAEAQCVELERLGLVQGVISDDSDVWAFGVRNVYRHLFSKNKNVQHYDSRVVRQSLGLSQADFVGIAVLSGGDYSPGLASIGIVNAVELLSEFAVSRSDEQGQSQEKETMLTLRNVEAWMATFDSNEDPPEPVALRRKLRAIIKKNNDMERIKSIVNPDVVAAYFQPNVDKSREKFRWKKVDMERVRILLYSRLGWDDEKCDKQTLIPLQRWNDFITGAASYQRHITSFTHKLQQSPAEQKTTLTKRVETALANLAKRTGSSSNISALSSKPLEKKVSKKQSRPVRTRAKKSATKSSPKDLQLSEDSDSDEG